MYSQRQELDAILTEKRTVIMTNAELEAQVKFIF